MYIFGSSINLYKRLKSHINSLVIDKHFNIRLQHLYNKYKEFKYSILEFCDPNILLDREEYYISKYETVNVIKQPTQFRRGYTTVPIDEYDIFGNIVKSGHSAYFLCKELKINDSTLYEALRKKQYYFNNGKFYIKSTDSFNLQNYHTVIVVLCDLNNNIMKYYNSLTDANIDLCNGKDALRYYIKRKKVFNKKYYIKYFNNYQNER